MDRSETPLEGIAAIPRDIVTKLAGRWITSAEQLVAIAGSGSGVTSLSRELGIDEGETRSVLEAARSALDPATIAKLERPVDTSRYPLGAHRPTREPNRDD